MASLSNDAGIPAQQNENTNPTPSVSTGTTETFTTSTAPLSPKSPKSEGILKTTTIETATYSPAFGEVLEHHLQSDEWDASKVPPSRFQKRKGSILATPASRDSHVDAHKDRDAKYHDHKLIAGKVKDGGDKSPK